MASSEPPGPDGLPLLGSALTFLGDPVAAFEDWTDRYGDFAAITVAGVDFYVVAHPDYVEEVLVTKQRSFEKGYFQNEYLGAIIGDGLLLSEGDYWREQRGRIQPAFSPEHLARYADTMTAYAREVTGTWSDGQTLVLDEALRHLSLRIMARTLFGVDLSDVGDTFEKTALTISERFDLSSFSTFLPSWVPTPRQRAYERALADLDAAIYGLIEDRRNARSGHSDLLSILLAAEADDGTRLSDETIRDEIATVLLGGHDTTALAMTYTLYLLAKNPGVEARVRSELEAVLGGAVPTLADASELTTLERAITEAMRIYPPAYTLFREPTEPVTVAGYDVPEATTLALPQWVVHRDERWYDDPEEFRPERWADGSNRDRPEYAYFPFAGGPRRCVGMQYGLLEAKLVLATLLQEYEFSVAMDEPLSFSPALTLQPEHGVTVRVDERDAP